MSLKCTYSFHQNIHWRRSSQSHVPWHWLFFCLVSRLCYKNMPRKHSNKLRGLVALVDFSLDRRPCRSITVIYWGCIRNFLVWYSIVKFLSILVYGIIGKKIFRQKIFFSCTPHINWKFSIHMGGIWKKNFWWKFFFLILFHI